MLPILKANNKVVCQPSQSALSDRCFLCSTFNYNRFLLSINGLHESASDLPSTSKHVMKRTYMCAFYYLNQIYASVGHTSK